MEPAYDASSEVDTLERSVDPETIASHTGKFGNVGGGTELMMIEFTAFN